MHDYVDADTLWQFIDEQMRDIEQLSDEEIGANTEAYKMYLLGKRDMLRLFCTFTSDNSQKLRSIVERLDVIHHVLFNQTGKDDTAQIFANEWYVSYGPLGSTINSEHCLKAFEAGYTVAMVEARAAIDERQIEADMTSGTCFEPFVRVRDLPKKLRPET